KTFRPEEHAAGRRLELLQELAARRALALYEQIHFLPSEKAFHLERQLLHRPITGEKNKGASLGVFDKARHPFRTRGAVASVARIRHLSHNEQLHFLLESKRAAELQRLSVVRTDSSAEIGQVWPADGERRTRHPAAAIVAE